jgi:hypothetical protein
MSTGDLRGTLHRVEPGDNSHHVATEAPGTGAASHVTVAYYCEPWHCHDLQTKKKDHRALMHLMSYDPFSLRLNATTPNTSCYSEWNRVEALFSEDTASVPANLWWPGP